MKERRTVQRTPAQALCTLSVEGREVDARLENLTDQGALFSLRRSMADEAPPFYLGRSVTFVVSSFKPPRKYTGKVIRLYYEGGAPHIALKFLRKYESIVVS
jgi:hypothetical protein